MKKNTIFVPGACFCPNQAPREGAVWEDVRKKAWKNLTQQNRNFVALDVWVWYNQGRSTLTGGFQAYAEVF